MGVGVGIFLPTCEKVSPTVRGIPSTGDLGTDTTVPKMSTGTSGGSGFESNMFFGSGLQCVSKPGLGDPGRQTFHEERDVRCPDS